MRRQEHIADEILLEYAEGRLAAAAAARVTEHLDTACAPCRSGLAGWRRVLAALAADRASAPPAALVQSAFALFERREPAPTTWQRLAATLSFDSRLQPAPAGARDAGRSSFQLAFTAGGLVVDLLCEPAQGSWRITGQALATPPPELGWRVSAVPVGYAPPVPPSPMAGAPVETETDSLGEFGLAGLRPGRYQITLRERQREFVLPEIELQPL
jgi:hypothetical protein